MAALLGMMTGVGLGALSGYKRQKQAERQHQEAAWTNFLETSIRSDPVGAAAMVQTPAGRKALKGIYGDHDDVATQMIMSASNAKKAELAAFQQAEGFGGAQPGTAAPAATAQWPTDVAGLTAYQDKLMRAQASGLITDPSHQRVLANHIEEVGKRIQRAFDAEQRAKYGSPEAAAARTTASTNARIAAETSPSAVAAEAGLAGARSGAETRARQAALPHYANLAAELQALSPSSRLSTIRKLYADNYPKGDSGPKLVPDPSSPGHFKLSTGGETPSFQDFAHHLGIDPNTGAFAGPAAAAPPGTPASAASPDRAINVPGMGSATFDGTTDDGRPIYRFANGKRMALKRRPSAAVSGPAS